MTFFDNQISSFRHIALFIDIEILGLYVYIHSVVNVVLFERSLPQRIALKF